MPRHSHRDEDVIAVLQRELRETQKELRKLRNQKNPTLPIFNKSSLPEDLQDGQLYIGTDNSLCIRKGGNNYTVSLSAF